MKFVDEAEIKVEAGKAEMAVSAFMKSTRKVA